MQDYKLYEKEDNKDMAFIAYYLTDFSLGKNSERERP